MTPSIRILIADDHAQVRQDLRMVIELADGFEVVGEAADGQAAVQQALRLQPDVVLIDLEMPAGSGLDAIRALKARSRAQVVVLTVHAYPAARDAAERAGCDAFLVKGADFSIILKTIAQVMSKQ